MSCLFQSLSHFVPDGPQEIRQRICDYLESDTPLFDGIRSSDVTSWVDEKPLQAYVNDMRKSSVWGGAIEIKAFCELYNFNVHVVDVRGKKVAEFVPSMDHKGSVATLRWTGSHYDPVVERPRQMTGQVHPNVDDNLQQARQVISNRRFRQVSS